MLEDHRVMHFPSAISHPQLVGLSEHYVQKLMRRIPLQCLSLESSGNWRHEIRNAVLAINTRCILVHEHTPAGIFLEFNLLLNHKMDAGLHEFMWRVLNTGYPSASTMPKELSINRYIDSCEEYGLQAGMRLGEAQDWLQSKKTHAY